MNMNNENMHPILEVLVNADEFILVANSGGVGKICCVGMEVDTLIDAWVNHYRESNLTPKEIQNKFNDLMIISLEIPDPDLNEAINN